ncbi:MAG TPA: Hpt domain-containing protein [Opitutaceae bacterium]|jgi:HPt (histidine-containing phosphotransfer) domain-containing protein
MDEGAPAWPPREPEKPVVLDRVHWETLRGPKDENLVASFMLLFSRDEPARIAQLPALYAARDGKELSRCAHTIAGSCAMLGAREMQMTALGLERAAHNNLWDEIPLRLTAVNEAWDRLRVVLKDEGFSLT